MIFTGQAWNMTFSLYHSLKSVPQDIEEVSVVYRFTWWERFKWMELPYGTTGLVWNSMMSMAGGWFFLMINEAFRLGDHDFRLPGLGSYMSVAVHEGKPLAMALAVVAMMLMIVALDQLLWRPVVVWAQRFRVEETHRGRDLEKLVPGPGAAVGSRPAAPLLAPQPVASSPRRFGDAEPDPPTRLRRPRTRERPRSSRRRPWACSSR